METAARTTGLIGAVFLVYLTAVALTLAGGEWLGFYTSMSLATELAQPSIVLATGIAAVLLARRLDRRFTLADFPPVRLLLRTAPWSLAAAYALVASVVAVRKHELLDTFGFDLGCFENILWNSLAGRPLYSSLLDRNQLGEHVSPLLLALVPPYALWRDPRLLLVLQSVLLALPAIAIYQYAARRLGRAAATGLVLAYVVYGPLHGVNFFDFHELALAVPLLAFAFVALEDGRRAWFLVLLALAVLVKEQIPLVAAAFGVYLLFSHEARDRQLGGVLVAAGVCLFVVEVRLILPYFRNAPFPYADRYSHLGASMGEVLRTGATDPVAVLRTMLIPEKLDYLRRHFLPLAFLPVAGWLPLLLALPTLASSLLSNHPSLYSVRFHFSAPAIPFIFFATIVALDRLGHAVPRALRALAASAWGRRTGIDAVVARLRVDRPRVIRALVGAVVIAAWLWGSNPFRYLRPVDHDDTPDKLAAMIARMPADASVSASNSLAAHVARRRDVSVFPDLRSAEYVLLRNHPIRCEYPLTCTDMRRTVAGLLLSGEYGVAEHTGQLLLLRSGGSQHSEDVRTTLRHLFLRFEAEYLGRRTGLGEPDRDASNGWTVRVRPRRDRPGPVLSGPHAALPPGRYRVFFLIRRAAGIPGDELAVISASGESQGELPLLGSRTIPAPARADDGYMSWSLTFDTTVFDTVSFRVVYSGRGSMWVDRVDVEPDVPFDTFLERVLRPDTPPVDAQPRGASES